MSDPKLISPLLDGYAMGSPISEHDGVICCPAMKENSDNRYIVKIISIPASQVQLDALLLTGAYQDPADAMDYFKELTDGVEKEAQLLNKLSKLEGFLPYDAWQIEPMDENRLGYEIYLISSYKRSLERYLQKNPMTHLGAVNLGLDLCAALSIARRAGHIYVDLKPGNIFISGDREYRIGDLGFMALDSLKYATLPSKYCSPYTAPEIRDALGTVNTTADTYALGMILYQIYNNGQLPVVDPESEDPLPFPVNADYEMAEILLKACAPNPALRYPDPTQMGQALVAYMQRNRVNDTPINPVAAVPVVTSETPILEETQNAEDESAPSEADAADIAQEQVSEETSSILDQADMLMTDEAPAGDAPTPEDPIADSEEEADQLPAPEESDPETEETEPKEVEATAPEAADPAPDAPEAPAFSEEEEITPEDFLSMGEAKEEPAPEAPKEKPKKKKKKSKKKKGKKKKKKSKAGLILAILLLLLSVAGIGGYYYYDNYYLQTIHSIQVEGAGDEMTVHLDTQADNTLLTVLITDTYGNTQKSPVSNNQASFDGLLPGTLYKIRVEISGFHALHPKGVASHGYTTDSQTKIVSLTAKTGPEDGTVVLNFAVEGASPEKWIASYSSAEGEALTHEFSGRMTTISGLTLGETYTFTLEPVGGLVLVGENSISFTASPIIVAENLQISSYSGDTLTANWNAPADVQIDNWTVRCYSDNGFDSSLTTTDTTASFTGIDSTRAYTLEVLAAGMTNPARISITANPYNVSNLKVDDSDSSRLVLSWINEGAAPADGWIVKYTVDGSVNQGVAQCNGNTAVIQPRIPGATYLFRVESTDGNTVFGSQLSYDCPNASIFEATDMLVSKDDVNRQLSVNMLVTPEIENWTGADVTSKDFTSTLKSGQKGSLLLHLNTNFLIRELDVEVLFVIRNANGDVLTDHVSQVNTNWSALWYADDYQTCELDIPSIPTEPGEYTLYLYFNHAAITTVKFTVTN